MSIYVKSLANTLHEAELQLGSTWKLLSLGVDLKVWKSIGKVNTDVFWPRTGAIYFSALCALSLHCELQA